MSVKTITINLYHIFHLFQPEIIVLSNNTAMEPIKLCSSLTGNECGGVKAPQWDVDLPDTPKPKPNQNLPPVRNLH